MADSTEQPEAALVDKALPKSDSSAAQQPSPWQCALITALIFIATILVNVWLSTHEFARLAGYLGLPIVLTLIGWWVLADGLRFEDTREAMFKDNEMTGSLSWLYYCPAIPSAITLVSFTSVVLSRVFNPGKPIFTPLLGQFFLAYCVVNVFGCLLVSTRSYTLCWRHRR